MDDIFKKYPEVEKVYVTSDEQKFFKEHYANSHAQTLKDKEVSVLKRTEKPELKLDHETRIAIVEALESVEDIEKALEGEKAKTVLEAGKKRIEELTQNQE